MEELYPTYISIALWNDPQRYSKYDVIVYGYSVGQPQYDVSATFGITFSPFTTILLTAGFISVELTLTASTNCPFIYWYFLTTLSRPFSPSLSTFS